MTAPRFIPSLPLRIFSPIYRFAVHRRNARFDRGRGVSRFDIPVVSVGNISTGGTGKSPIVRSLCEILLELDRAPVIAMRGYAASRTGASDEAAEYADCFGSRVPVVAHPDRTSALRSFLARHPGIDCIVLDDGFQHRQIARDLDLVLIDASQRTFRDELLPAGRLREPLEQLTRPDAVIITRGEHASGALEADVERYTGKLPVAVTRHVWESVEVHRQDEVRTASTKWIDGKRFCACFGVGNPASIEAQLKVHGGLIRKRVSARDHQAYNTRKVRLMREACADGIDALIITRKDWVKFRKIDGAATFPVPIAIPRLRIHFERGEEALRSMLAQAVGVGV